MSSDENEGLCDYQIVEFVTRGRPGVRKIDLVPTKWIEYDVKKGKLVTKFKPPPYEEQDFKIITDLAKKLADAPNDWVTYGIKVRARAKTYTDGCAKLKSLESQLYAFTDSGADPEKVAANIEESLKTQTLKQQVQNLKATMSAVTPIPEKPKRNTSRPTGKKRLSDRSARKDVKVTTSSKQQVSQKDRQLMCSRHRIFSSSSSSAEDSICDEAEKHTSNIFLQTEKDIGLQSQLQLPNDNLHDSTKKDEFNNNTSEVIPKIKHTTMTIQKLVGTAKEATDATERSKSLSTMSAVTPIPEKSKRDTSRPTGKKRPFSDQSARKDVKVTTSSKQQVLQKDRQLMCSRHRIFSSSSSSAEDSICDEAEKYTSNNFLQTEKDIGLQSQLQLPNDNLHDSTKKDEFNNNTSEVIPKIKHTTMTIQKFVGTAQEATDATKRSKSLSKSQFLLIMNCIQGISVNVNEIMKNQREMRDLFEASGVIKDGIGANNQSFTDKYNISFPMRTKDDLSAFQEMLKTNDICRRDFKAFLYFFVDRQLNISKSVTNIMKKLVTRELALICTAQKKIDAKIVLKDTPICDCIIDVVVNIIEKHGKCITQKEIYSAIGITLTNAKDWDGHRLHRSKKARNDDQINP
ncbi:uncharacterized protein [Temnothorax nylanderi]|uniref:uncharacterized protein isoform X2 n=1 Tax=Temnothorax nylanderi TaxID=102681 RepID=UPI003A8686AD